MRCIGDALESASASFAAAGVPEPRADAEVLLAYVMNTSRTTLRVRAGEALNAPARAAFDALADRRRRRVPVFQLVGRREFWSLDIEVDRRVLTPRPETEILVETALGYAARAKTIVDAGTGSGAVAIALAGECPRAVVLALDVDRGALEVARRNVERLAPTVRLVRSTWLAALAPASVDLVVSNPPYVPDADVGTTEPEVRDYEPRVALAGGPDGLRHVRRLVEGAPRVLRPGGALVLEVGAGQAGRVAALFAGSAWSRAEITPDLAGIPRVVAARWSVA